MAITNPTSFYNFNSGNSNDSIGSNNGTDTNMSYTNGAAKVGSYGAAFGGSTSKIVFPSTLAVGSNLNASFSYWFKIGNGDTTRMALMGWGDSAGIGIQVEIYNGGLSYYESANGAFGYDGTNIVNNGAFHHLVLTYTSGALKGYLDNSQIWTGSGALSLSNGSGNRIGHRLAGDDSAALNGSMDCFGVWAGYTLTSGEVGELYNSGSGTEGPFGGGSTPTGNMFLCF